jgi:hypothetical protein
MLTFGGFAAIVPALATRAMREATPPNACDARPVTERNGLLLDRRGMRT